MRGPDSERITTPREPKRDDYEFDRPLARTRKRREPAVQLAPCSLCGGVLLRSSCASCYAHARERRDLVAAHRLYRTALFWMADLTKIQGRRVCRPFAPECSSITKIEWLQRSPRVPPQLRFSNLRLGEETANAPLVYLPTYTSGWPQDIAIELGPFESR